MMSYKSKQFLWLVLKLLIVIVFGYSIYEEIAYNEKIKFRDFYSILIDFDVFSIKNITFLIIFSAFNWFLEITKWRILVTKIQFISWSQAAKQSLSSLSFSLITPNRIGEYGAKALYYPKAQRKEILILNFIGNFYQLIVTVFIGLIGMLYLRQYFSNTITEEISIVATLAVVVIILCFLFVERISFLKKWRKKVTLRLNFRNDTSNQKVLFISFLRYFIFSHQFYFLLLIFMIDISYWNVLACISSMYLISSVIPALSIFDFVIKGSVAVYVFSFFEINPIIVLSITTLMWILNFAIPAMIGSYFVLQFKPASND